MPELSAISPLYLHYISTGSATSRARRGRQPMECATALPWAQTAESLGALVQSLSGPVVLLWSRFRRDRECSETAIVMASSPAPLQIDKPVKSCCFTSFAFKRRSLRLTFYRCGHLLRSDSCVMVVGALLVLLVRVALQPPHGSTHTQALVRRYRLQSLSVHPFICIN